MNNKSYLCTCRASVTPLVHYWDIQVLFKKSHALQSGVKVAMLQLLLNFVILKRCIVSPIKHTITLHVSTGWNSKNFSGPKVAKYTLISVIKFKKTKLASVSDAREF